MPQAARVSRQKRFDDDATHQMTLNVHNSPNGECYFVSAI
jgi:hypothetical protein